MYMLMELVDVVEHLLSMDHLILAQIQNGICLQFPDIPKSNLQVDQRILVI